MTDRTISNAINAWRASWAYDRRKHDLGRTEQEDWEEYVNSLTISEVLWNLEIHDE